MCAPAVEKTTLTSSQAGHRREDVPAKWTNQLGLLGAVRIEDRGLPRRAISHSQSSANRRGARREPIRRGRRCPDEKSVLQMEKIGDLAPCRARVCTKLTESAQLGYAGQADRRESLERASRRQHSRGWAAPEPLQALHQGWSIVVRAQALASGESPCRSVASIPMCSLRRHRRAKLKADPATGSRRWYSLVRVGEGLSGLAARCAVSLRAHSRGCRGPA
jgi:hypothetical protein